MYTVNIQRFEPGAAGSDITRPVVVKTVGRLKDCKTALAYARMWSRYDGVDAVWIGTDYSAPTLRATSSPRRRVTPESGPGWRWCSPWQIARERLQQLRLRHA
jgi:hypothetical protein